MNSNYPSIDKLTDYLNGELSVEEAAGIKAWFNQSEEKKKELEHLEIIWSLSRRLDEMEKIDKQKAKKKVNSRVSPTLHQWNVLIKRERPSIAGRKKRLLKTKIYLHYFQRAAAILILPVLLFTTYLYFHNGQEAAVSSNREVVAAYGTRSSLILPDGSKVWLNSGSKLTYPPDFTQNNRTIFLTGEAFFDVVSDKAKPFDVITGQFTVRAVGTEFNVFSYEDDEFETSLEDGVIQLFKTGGTANHEPILKVKPGQRVTFNEEQKKLVLTDDDVARYSLWREGKLSFKNDPMDEVIKKLERWYNVDIELKDPELSKYRYTAVFENETVQQAMEMLSFSSPITYSIFRGEKQQDNTYAKSKIEIRLRH
jgi:ferric-dicitrate binding protein FerR (iron transport regulator)